MYIYFLVFVLTCSHPPPLHGDVTTTSIQSAATVPYNYRVSNTRRIYARRLNLGLSVMSVVVLPTKVSQTHRQSVGSLVSCPLTM